MSCSPNLFSRQALMAYREHPCRRKNKTILSKYPFKPECSAAAQSTMTGVQGSPTNYVMSLVLPLTGWGSTISIQRPYVQIYRSKWNDIAYANVYMHTVFWQEHLCDLLPNLRHIINRKSIYIATRYRWTTQCTTARIRGKSTSGMSSCWPNPS